MLTRNLAILTLSIACASVFAADPPASAGSSAAVIPIDFNHRCPDGGTRATKGTFDTTTGTLSITETLTGCMDEGATHDGTVTVNGTIVIGTGGAYSLDLVYVFNTHFVNAREDVKRVCTWTKIGSFDAASERFHGTLTKTNCVLTLDEMRPGNVIEHILRKAHQVDD